jgi:IPT/TIG domain
MRTKGISIRGRVAFCAVAFCLGFMVAPLAAQAQSVLLGRSDLSTSDDALDCDGPACYWGNIAIRKTADPGSLATAPADGTVTSWRVKGQVAGSGKIFIHVIHPLGGGEFTATSDSLGATHTDGTTPNPTSLDMEAGDLISATVVSYNLAGAVAHLGTITSPGAIYSAMPILSSASGSVTLDGTDYVPDVEPLYNATVELMVPKLDSISAHTGSVEGGTPVTISGAHLSVTKSVDFGGTPATVAFANNETIVVLAPPRALAGPVDVTVSTAGGRSATSEASQFTYDDGKPPLVSKVKFARKKFVAGNIGGPIVASSVASAVSKASAKSRVGSKVSYRLSEGATVKVTVKRKNRHGRLKKVGKSFATSGVAGKNSFVFSGRLKGGTLKPGKYKLLLSAKDSLGNSSKKSAAAAFRITS